MMVCTTRIQLFKCLSDCARVNGSFHLNSPALFLGNGVITFKGRVVFGYSKSPGFYDRVIHIEARNKCSVIEIDDGVNINNGTTILCESTNISIGSNTLIGPYCLIVDSDFHAIEPSMRINGIPAAAPVQIGTNVFIGSHVKVLKGVTIGDNSTIGCGAVVSKSIPPNVIAAGNPCRVIKSILL